MRKVVDDMRLMIKVCDLYYNHNVSQQQIAGMLSLSRPTVSRLLSSAREKGIVQISVSNLGLIKYWEMERRLEEMYGLREVLIVDSSDDSDRQRRFSPGKAAGRYLESTIKDGSVVGVSMGSTLYEVVAHINQPAAEDVTFVPLKSAGWGSFGWICMPITLQRPFPISMTEDLFLFMHPPGCQA